MLLRLIPRVSRICHLQFLGASASQSTCKLSSIACIKPIFLASRSIPMGLVTRKRTLAGDHKEDFILHQNSLTESEKKEIESSVKKDFEDWIPYGFCPTDKEEDIYRYKLFLFSSMTMGIVVFSYLFYNLPPPNRREWVTREAYLELERRQRLGLPLVDKDLIPADQILLPSLEELGDDYELII